MTALNQALASVFGAGLSLVYAVVLLIVAWVVALIAETVVVKLCGRPAIAKRLGKLGGGGDGKAADGLVNTFGKIVFVVVFVLFLPGILNILNLQGVSQPIANMMNVLFGFLPNIIGAIVIFVIGLFLARIVKQIVTSVLRGLKFDKLQEKVGIKPDGSAMSFSALVGNVVYALILIPVIIAALQVLNISSISDPAIYMLNTIFGMIPNVFIAVVLIVVGVFIGRLVGTLTAALLSGLGLNGLFSGFFKESEEGGKKILVSNLVGDLVKYIIILLLAVQSLSVLHLDVLNSLGSMIVAYLPNFVGALIILCAGLFLSALLEKTMKKYAADSAVSASLVKYAVIVITVFMTLNQLKIASFIVNTAFIVILGAAAVAFAIAFGIGGRDTAARVLRNLDGVFAKKDGGDKTE